MGKLLIVCGISFAGKSTLGHAIAQHFGYAEVDVDDTKFSLYGPAIQDGDLRDADWKRVYAETDNLIERHVKASKTVVDASRNFKKREREAAQQLAARLKIEMVTIYVDTSADIACQRLFANRDRQVRLDVTDTDFATILQVTEPPTPDENALVFYYGDDIEQWIKQNFSTLC